MSRPAGTDWDAQRYHRVARPHAAWGASVLDRLVLRGDETVLDAGCGSGTVTLQLLERLPRGRVVGVDLSPAMLEQARNALQAFAPRVQLLQANLVELDRVVPHESVDAVFSTATFHWIEDHPRLFRAVHAVSRKPGRLVAQYGGGDNLAAFMRLTDAVGSRPPYAQHLAGKALWRFFSTPERTHSQLQAAGFTDVEAWLEPSPQTFADGHALADFARAVVLRRHVDALPSDVQDAFVTEVVEEVERRQGGYILDYVRLNVDATAV